MPAIYNEIDPYAAQWLRNLSDRDLIAPGSVEERSIAEIKPRDITGATQFHTFAGIGVWSYALRLAGWPDDAAVWTGSCPCQPFSVAGRRRGSDDERHLWPVWRDLIGECAPPVVFGEQVASPDGRRWLDAVLAEMEDLGYAVAAADLCAAGIGAPHVRQRLFFGAVRLADLRSQRLEGLGVQLRERPQGPNMPEAAGRGEDGRMGDADGLARNEGNPNDGRRREGDGSESRTRLSRASHGGRMGNASMPRLQGRLERGDCACQRAIGSASVGVRMESPIEGIAAWRAEDCPDLGGAVRGFWAGADWLLCRDPSGGAPKLRPVEPGAFPLAHGATARVGRIGAYGNAIVPQVAATFVSAFTESIISAFAQGDLQ